MAKQKKIAVSETDGIVRANIERNMVVSPTFASHYANDTQVQTTPWDVRLMFGVIVEVDPTNKRVVVEQIVDVRMSPQHAKKVAEVLVAQLRGYEATVGPIPLPKTE